MRSGCFWVAKNLRKRNTKTMSLTLAQLGAMTFYEFRMHWRRKGMIAITAIVIFSALAAVLSGNINSANVGAAQAAITAEGQSSEAFMATIMPIVLMITW